MNLYKITTTYYMTAHDGIADEKQSVYYVVAATMERAIAMMTERVKKIEVLCDWRDGAQILIDNGE